MSATTRPLHTRSLLIELRREDDDRMSARAEVLDLRKAGFVPLVDQLQTAGVIHHMTLDARVHARSRVLEELVVRQPRVAVEASERSAGECCRDPAPRLQALVGRTFDGEIATELLRVFGGRLGCSHLLTLFQLLASALPDALDREDSARAGDGVARERGELVYRRSVFLDGYSAAGGLRLVVSLMDHHSEPRPAGPAGLELLARQHELQVEADVQLASLGIEALRATERVRTRQTLTAAPWRDLGAAIEGLAGLPIMPGLGRELRRRFGESSDRAPLRDALLQLAPGFVQCTPALADRPFEGRDGSSGRGRGRGEVPRFLTLGGAADSCYMWRAGGPLSPAPDAEGGS